MISLSQNDRNIIAEHSLNKCLNHLQDSLRKAEQNYQSNSLSNDDIVNCVNSKLQKTVSRLLYILQSHEVALNLHSKTENKNVTFELFVLFRRVRNNNFNYEHYRALSRLVLKQALDVEIWNAVFEFIITVSQTTSSTNIFVFFNDTFIMSLFVSQQDDKQTQKLMKARIFEKIKRCTYQNVENFFFKYFEKKSWIERTKKVYQAVRERHINEQWIDFSQTSIQNEICKW